MMIRKERKIQQDLVGTQWLFHSTRQSSHITPQLLHELCLQQTSRGNSENYTASTNILQKTTIIHCSVQQRQEPRSIFNTKNAILNMSVVSWNQNKKVEIPLKKTRDISFLHFMKQNERMLECDTGAFVWAVFQRWTSNYSAFFSKDFSSKMLFDFNFFFVAFVLWQD